MRLFDRLADWLVPADTVTSVGRVYWRRTQPALTFNPDAIRAAGGIIIPLQYDGYGQLNRDWQRWPTLHDLFMALPPVTAQRGGITYPVTA